MAKKKSQVDNDAPDDDDDDWQPQPQAQDVHPQGAPDAAVSADPQANRQRLMQGGDAPSTGRAPNTQRGAYDEQEPRPRFSEEGAPIDAGGLPRPLDPGEIPPDDVERSSYTVGKGGFTARGKVYVEGETVLLSEEEANQILDMGNKIEHSDPVEAKAISERRADRDASRREKHAEKHQAAVDEARSDAALD